MSLELVETEMPRLDPISASIRVQREPPGGWEAKAAAQAELDRCFGRSTMVNWLYVDWYSDEKGDPCERWVVYRMLPPQFIAPDALAGLNGPAPETLGYWSTVRRSYQSVAPGCHPVSDRQWISQATPGITQRAWELWRETGALASLFWVVQGPNGGHKYKIKSTYEKKARRFCGLPPDTPAIGTLSYAPFDARVIEQLVSLDEERKQCRLLNDFRNATRESVELSEMEEIRKLKQQLKKWWSDQVDEAVDLAGMTGMGGYWSRVRSDAPYTPEKVAVMRQFEQEYESNGLTLV